MLAFIYVSRVKKVNFIVPGQLLACVHIVYCSLYGIHTADTQCTVQYNTAKQDITQNKMSPLLVRLIRAHYCWEEKYTDGTIFRKDWEFFNLHKKIIYTVHIGANETLRMIV